MVYILVDGKKRCAGTLLNEDYVLTSAHCLLADDYNYNSYAYFNADDLKETFRIYIELYYTHPLYDDDRFDVAIAKLNG